MQASAQAQPNIALVKYWGKQDLRHNLPATGSISITLDAPRTHTRVNFSASQERDQFLLNGKPEPAMLNRVSACLDNLRALADCPLRARVESDNDFPTGAGLASSASGFAALVVAGASALGLNLDTQQLADLARRASGSAARSLLGGFVELLLPAADGPSTPVRSLRAAHEWPLAVAIAITSSRTKSVGSTEGMERSRLTSPYYPAWVSSAEDDLAYARQAISDRDFLSLARVSEFSCLKMHALAMSSEPGLLYFNGATVECLHRIRTLRTQGVPVFFTVDAGPQVKAVCLPEALEQVGQALADVPGVQKIIRCGLGAGARLDKE
ncbi:MAG: diphosphomevalonate decarboxylase [Gammaproteobacteria bacterium]|jgi:diphosphomevalonate decarboxylase|nr:diphosphomevalonate decarboxylase [Gammaproteobacteria bacterium]